MFTLSRQSLALAATSAILVLAVSGCTAASTQSKATACKSLLSSVDTVTSALNSSLSSLTSDPTSSLKKLQQASVTFHKGMDDITNPEVKKAGDKADAAVSTLSAAIKKALANPADADSAKLSAASQSVSSAFVDVRDLCK